MITITDSRVIDANSEHLGTPVGVLMDNAGKCISDYIESNHPGAKVVFVCGTGNNGGDGFAAALRIKYSAGEDNSEFGTVPQELASKLSSRALLKLVENTDELMKAISLNANHNLTVTRLCTLLHSNSI